MGKTQGVASCKTSSQPFAFFAKMNFTHLSKFKTCKKVEHISSKRYNAKFIFLIAHYCALVGKTQGVASCKTSSQPFAFFAKMNFTHLSKIKTCKKVEHISSKRYNAKFIFLIAHYRALCGQDARCCILQDIISTIRLLRENEILTAFV